MKEQWKDGKGRDLSELVGWVRYLSQRWGTAMAAERLANFSYELTEGQSSVRVEEERVERGGWIMHEQLTEVGGLRGLNTHSEEHHNIRQR